MPWTPPEWAKSPQELSDRWLGNCRKFGGHQEFFLALGWGDRLNHLFAAACVRESLGRKLNKRSAALLDLVERSADDPSVREQMLAELSAIEDESDEFSPPVVGPDAYVIATMLPHFAAGHCARLKKHREAFGKILAAMVGPSWPWSDAWRSDHAVSIARGIYDDRAWERMPILSDALIDAGCDERQIRVYCRGSGPFMRGCFVLDQVLKKRV